VRLCPRIIEKCKKGKDWELVGVKQELNPDNGTSIVANYMLLIQLV
jgi:hypothetical protein